jgi:hypothetical protein
MSNIDNPPAPFFKGDFLKSPLEGEGSFKSPLIKGDSGGCLVCYDINFEILYHLSKWKTDNKKLPKIKDYSKWAIL